MNNENKLINGNEKLAPKFTIGTANINPNDDKLAETKEKPKRKINNTDLGPDFVAPDGGWGWLVVVAAGTANLCCFPVLQQFGLLFADRLRSINLTTSQITTIINLNSCLTSCIGLLNGPLFRRYTYRQIGVFGALAIALSIFLMSISNSFVTYLLTFSFLYGVGSGINASANALALNTYFKEKRRIATGIAWTITGLGPIIMPQIIAVVMPLYGVHGTLWLYTGLAIVAAVCALVYQPVQKHVKKKLPMTDEESNVPAIECDYYNASITGYEIIDPATPMLPLANDGMSPRHSSSRTSIYSNRPSRFGSRISSGHSLVGQASSRPSSVNLTTHTKDREKRKISEIRIDEHPETDSNGNAGELRDIEITSPMISPNAPTIHVTDDEPTPTKPPCRKKSPMNTFNIEKEVLKGASKKLEELISSDKRTKTFSNFEHCCNCDELRQLHADTKLGEYIDEEIDEEEPHTFWQKVVVFFDLNLLRDITYVNLMMGVTLGNFAELNFSILTPFVLADWGFDKRQIATAMSLLGGVDISIRFFIPFIAGKIGWENKTFFLIGILTMASGRIFITFYQSYSFILMAFCWIGLGKGLRTVFMALVIPSYVPLSRLPAASGLQLLFAGIFYFIMGPIVGFIRDRTNFIVTLHCLNIATFFVAFCWMLEKFYRDSQHKKLLKKEANYNDCD